MNKQEMLDYLLSTNLFDKGTKNYPYAGLYYEEQMIDSNKTIPISELVERFIEIDKEFDGSSWNLLQILNNIDIIIPVENRKETTHMCAHCDPDSDDCYIFKDTLTGEYYLDVVTCEWDDYDDDFVHQKEYISYCPYCGRKLEEKFKL